MDGIIWNMKWLILYLMLLVLLGCDKQHIASPDWVGKYKNACLPEAIAMEKGLENVGIEADVMIIGADKWTHAVCVYRYKGKIWVWDSMWKSIPVDALWNAKAIANGWLDFTHEGSKLRVAYFLQ
jgi:hypothetical protein